MKKAFVEKGTNFILKYVSCDELKVKTIKYGLEGFYNVYAKMLVMLILSIIFNFTFEYLLLTVCYALIRRYSFGLHAKTSLTCWFTTIPIFITGSLLIKYYQISTGYYLMIWLICFIALLLWAPMDTKKRPLIREYQRIRQNKQSMVISILFLLMALITQNQALSIATIYALAIQTFTISHFLYKINGKSVNNYLNFN